MMKGRFLPTTSSLLFEFIARAELSRIEDLKVTKKQIIRSHNREHDSSTKDFLHEAISFIDSLMEEEE